MGAQILQFPEQPRLPFGTIDSLLANDLITPKQHWCAVHLMWLHRIQDRFTGSDDWRVAREREYKRGIDLLSEEDGQHTLNLCLRGWLNRSKINEIRSGLDALQAIWQRDPKGAA